MMWLIVAVSGPFAAFLAGYLINESRAAKLGMFAATAMGLLVIVRSDPELINWSAAGAVAGVVTAWVHLFRGAVRHAD